MDFYIFLKLDTRAKQVVICQVSGNKKFRKKVSGNKKFRNEVPGNKKFRNEVSGNKTSGNSQGILIIVFSNKLY